MIADTHPYQMTANEIGAAARRKCQSILGEIFWQIQKQGLVEHFPSAPAQIIDLRSGQGICSERMLRMFGERTSIIAFEPDIVNRETFRQTIGCTSDEAIELVGQSFTQSEISIQADLAIGASVLNSIEDNQQIIDKVSQCLSPNGVLILDFIDLSKCEAYPGSYAFRQYSEFIGQYQAKLGLEINVSGLTAMCKSDKWARVSVVTRLPWFLDETQRQLPSLILEYLTSEFERAAIAHPAEVHALLAELRLLASHANTVISGPLVYQLCAVRN